MGLRFGRFELLPVERTLLDAGHPVVMGARAFDLLLTLIERRERLVTKAELLDLVWPGLVVEEANLPVQVSGLRKIIGAQAVATVPGRGYRFALAIDGDEPAAVAGDRPPVVLSMLTNVPAAIDALFGRDSDLQTLPRWLSEHRMVTVLGAGGIGKTRVAQAAARASVGSFPDGVWWVDLAALSSADKLAPAIAAAARLQLGEGDAVVLLSQALAARDLLLVLDNCEHLAGDVARLVLAVLHGAAGVKVLATSQQALKIDGERHYLLSPLAVPPVGVSVATARDFAALQLLEHRAKAADPRFALTDATVGLAVDLCQQLDGAALAIEMAAARLPLLGLDGLHQRLGDRLGLLRAASREAPPRHRTLRATLDWSHELLAPNERAVLRRLAVFPGSFRPDAAQQTASCLALEPDSVLEALVGLIEKSLVSLDQLEPPRCRLPETTRHYAAERLSASGEADQARRRHIGFMTTFMNDAYASWLVSDEMQWRQHVDPELDNLRTALTDALSNGTDVAAGISLAASALPLWLQRDAQFRAEGLEFLRLAIDRLDPDLPRPIAARLWFASALLLPWQQLGARAPLLERAVALARVPDGSPQLCLSLLEQARLLARIGRCDEADTALDEAQSLLEAFGMPRLCGLHTMARAAVRQTKGDLEAAERLNAQAAELLSLCGAPSMALSALCNSADAAWARGDLDGAIAGFSKAVELARELPLSSADTLGVPLGNWGAALFEQGRIEQGTARIAEALRLLRKAGKAWELCDALAFRLVLQGRFRDAAQVQGYVDAVYSAASENRQPNEQRLHDRVLKRLRQEFDDPQLVQLLGMGSRLTEAMALSIAIQVGCEV